MTEFFLEVVNMSISASWIILAVLLFRFLLKKAPKWINVLLWGIVAVRLICPFSFESALSLIPSSQTINPEVALNQPVINSGMSVIDNVINPIIGETTISLQPEKDLNLFQFVTPYFAGLWLVGITALLIYTAVSFIRLKKKIGTAVLLRDNIYQSENVASPFVLGLIKPKIYLPFNIDKQDMEHVIAHEQAHISRKDHLWKPLGFLILTLHWFNPLVWVGYILLCRDIELACDEKVVKQLDSIQRADYSEALLSCSVNRKMIAACPLAFGEVGVKNRVKSVLNYKKPAFWLIVIAVIVSIAVAICFLTNPMTKNDIQTGMYKLSEELYSDGSSEDIKSNRIEIKTKGGMHIYHFIGEVLSTGGLYKEVHSKKDLSDLLSCSSEFSVDENLKSLLKNNKDAWYDKPFDNIKAYPYILMSQKDGSLYMVFADFENGEPTKIRYIRELDFADQEETITNEEETSQIANTPPPGSFENPYNVGDSARIRHGDINQKDVVYDYNASITLILTGTESEEKLKEISSNFEEEKEILEKFDLYLARIHLKYNEGSSVKDRLPTAFGVTAVRFDKQLQFIDPRFDIPDNIFKAADGEFYCWAPVLAVKNVSTRWLSITVGTHQGAPGIISGVCFAVPATENTTDIPESDYSYIYSCDDAYRTEHHGEGTLSLPEFPASIKLQTYGFVSCDDGCEAEEIINRAIQGFARAYYMEADGELEGNHKILKFKMTVPEPMIENLQKQGVYENILAELAKNYYYLIPIGEKHYAFIHLEGEDEAFADSIVKNAEVLIALP